MPRRHREVRQFDLVINEWKYNISWNYTKQKQKCYITEIHLVLVISCLACISGYKTCLFREKFRFLSAIGLIDIHDSSFISVWDTFCSDIARNFCYVLMLSGNDILHVFLSRRLCQEGCIGNYLHLVIVLLICSITSG